MKVLSLWVTTQHREESGQRTRQATANTGLIFVTISQWRGWALPASPPHVPVVRRGGGRRFLGSINARAHFH